MRFKNRATRSYSARLEMMTEVVTMSDHDGSLATGRDHPDMIKIDTHSILATSIIDHLRRPKIMISNHTTIFHREGRPDPLNISSINVEGILVDLTGK